MDSDEEKKKGGLILDSDIDELKAQLESLGGYGGFRGVLLSLDEELSKINLMSAFPSQKDEKLVYANVGFACPGLEFIKYIECENETEDKIDLDKKNPEEETQKEGDALIIAKLGQLQTELRAMRFNEAMKDAKARVESMDYNDLQDITSMVMELMVAVQKRQETLNNEEQTLNKEEKEDEKEEEQ